MTGEARPTGAPAGFHRLSTAVKLLLILGAALFPLGLIAVVASIDAARESRLERELLTRLKVQQSASSLGGLIGREALALEAAAMNAAGASGAQACALAARSLDATGARSGNVALLAKNGTPLCAVRGRPRLTDGGDVSSRIALDPAARAVRLNATAGNRVIAGDLSLEVLRRAGDVRVTGRPLDLSLVEGKRAVRLLDDYERGLFQRTRVNRAALAGTPLTAVVAAGAIPISAAEILTILLPILMWLAGALVGWLIADRLLLRPIVTLREAVLGYRPGTGPLALPRLATPASEIRDLGEAFTRVTRTITAHEAEIDAAMGRQTLLVREVHHRVKNNLQVIASLLNLHARGARSEEAAAAYATIQRRVDALAVVHRNHFAELEDNRGIALRSLLSELTANLRGNATAGASAMAIQLDADAVHTTQDVAVSVAFLITEVVEYAMLCAPEGPVTISLREAADGASARLVIQSASLQGETDCEKVDGRQFERITTGLSRQLRGNLVRDEAAGTFSLDIALMPPREG